MKKGDTFINDRDGKRYRLGKVIWRAQGIYPWAPKPSPTEQTPMTSPSYIIVERATGHAVAEFYSPTIVKLINPDKYDTIPVMEYLQRLNARIKEEQNQ